MGLFILSIFLPALLVAIVWRLEKGPFSRLSYWKRQLVIGILFGGLAVLTTGMGLKGSVSVNIRDVAPVAAGIFFGGPAGIIAGFIGGMVRILVSILGGLGSFSGIASSLCTLLAGAAGALIRKIIDGDRHSLMPYSVFVVAMVKVVHMMMIFVFRINEFQQAFAVVQQRVIWMVITNCLSMVLAVLVYSRCTCGEDKWRPFSSRKGLPKISDSVQGVLMLCLGIAFLITGLFIGFVQDGITEKNVEDTLAINIQDIPNDVLYTYSSTLAQYSMWIVEDIENLRSCELGDDEEKLYELELKYRIVEIYIVDSNGIVTYCGDKLREGIDIHDYEAMENMANILGALDTVWLDDYTKSYFYDALELQYVGCTLKDGGMVILGYDKPFLKDMVEYQLLFLAASRHIGRNGFAIVAETNGEIVSDGYSALNNSMTYKQTLQEIGIIPDEAPKGTVFRANIYDIDSYCMYTDFSTMAGDYLVVVALPVSEARFSQEMSTFTMIFIETVVFMVLFVMLYFQMKKRVITNIQNVNCALEEITAGNLNVVMDVRDNEEFNTLSDDINATVDALKLMIAKEAARIDQDLANAKAIQLAALPSVFPPFPDKKEFEIWASMDAAKEVGGDFYDFYMPDGDHLVFLVADVSGKGIPAAMFMMTSKTLIKGMVEDGGSLADAFTRANQELCDNAKEKMFVTAWMGMLDLSTGMLRYVNAGHNPPIICKEGSRYEYLRTRPNLVLAGMKGIKYRQHELQLEPGDELFLYTDGVTEALNPQKKLYGEARLLELFTSGRIERGGRKEVLDILRQDIYDFAAGEEQADDITMLTLRYNGR